MHAGQCADSQQPQGEVLYEEITGRAYADTSFNIPVNSNETSSGVVNTVILDKNNVINRNPLYKVTTWANESVNNEYCIILPVHPEKEISESTTAMDNMTSNEAYGTVMQDTDHYDYDTVM